VPSTKVSPAGSPSLPPFLTAPFGPVAVVTGGAAAPAGRPVDEVVPLGALVVAVVAGGFRVVAVVGTAVDGVVAAGPEVGGGAALLGGATGAVVAEVAGAEVARVVAEPPEFRRLSKFPPARTLPFFVSRGIPVEPAYCAVRSDRSPLRTASATTPTAMSSATTHDSTRISSRCRTAPTVPLALHGTTALYLQVRPTATGSCFQGAMSGKSEKGPNERREWDLNPRGLRPTIFKTVPFGRSGIPPGKEATRPCGRARGARSADDGEAGDHGQDREGHGEEGAAFTPPADAAADRDEQAESKGEKQRRGEHESPSRFAADAFEEHIGTKGTNL
jgi:hypothetical protein